MTEKITFTMQIFALGFSVVMVVLFLLYALLALVNGLWSRPPKKIERKEPLPPEEISNDGYSLQLAAAITAAINRYRSVSSPEQGAVRDGRGPAEVKGSRWAAAGREALLENSILWVKIRGK